MISKTLQFLNENIGENLSCDGLTIIKNQYPKYVNNSKIQS